MSSSKNTSQSTTALPGLIGNKLAKSKVDPMKNCQEQKGQTEADFWINKKDDYSRWYAELVIVCTME